MGFVDAIETLKDARQIFRRNADAGVRDDDASLFRPSEAGRDPDVPSGVAELDRVVEQIDQRLLEPQTLAEDLETIRLFKRKIDVARAGLSLDCSGCGIEYGLDRETRGFRGLAASVELRENQQIGSDITQASRVVFDNFDEAAAVCRVVQSAIEQRFGIAANRRE